MVSKRQKGRADNIPDLNALAILRSQIKPNRPETEADWGILDELLGNRLSEPPPGAWTRQQFQDRYKMSGNGSSHHFLKKRVEEGILETGMFIIPGKTGETRFYWLASSAKATTSTVASTKSKKR